jgi:hypothetical protein
VSLGDLALVRRELVAGSQRDIGHDIAGQEGKVCVDLIQPLLLVTSHAHGVID